LRLLEHQSSPASWAQFPEPICVRAASFIEKPPHFSSF
jgi:hypothetical protein